MKLNKEQHQAIHHTGSPLVIYAGPGTGKTLILQKRYEHLINTDVPTNRILGITFTRNAASELTDRIAKTTQVASDLIIVRTFHSLCLNMVRKYHTLSDLSQRFSIADPKEQDQIIVKCLQEQSLPFTRDNVIKIKQIIGQIKKEQHTENRTYIEEYANLIYPHYQQKLLEAGKIDYDDIIKKALEILESEVVLQEYQNLYQHILLDEAQDTTIPQSKIIYKLNCTNTVIVGDQNQAIYSFAGANPNFMREFEQETHATVITLKHNYRNPQNIIHSATEVIRYNQNYIETELKSDKQTHRKIGILHPTDEKQEAILIASSIKHNTLKNVTILYRRNDSAKEIEFALQEKGIPYTINGIHFLERKEIKNIIAVIQWIERPEDPLHFKNVLSQHTGIGKTTIERIIQTAQHTHSSLIKTAQQKLERLTIQQHLTLKLLCETIQQIPSLPKAEQLEKITTVLTKPPRTADEIENISEFKRIALTSDAPLIEILNYIKSTETQPRVRLMTLHAAKGTEDNIIFIIGAEEGLIPDENAYISQHLIEEERRLFYVGLTRTKDALILSHTQNRFLNGYNLTQQPSRFIEEIPEKEHL